MTAGERHFVRAVRDVQTRYELLLAEERERSDRHAATVAERDQRIANLRARIDTLSERVGDRDALVSELRKTMAAGRRELFRLEAVGRAERATLATLRRKVRAQQQQIRNLTVKDPPAPADPLSLSARFWAKVVITPTGCWRWTGATTAKGYGRISVNDVTTDAHRAAFIVTGRDRPAVLRRGCSERACVNPDHWYARPSYTKEANDARGE